MPNKMPLSVLPWLVLLALISPSEHVRAEWEEQSFGGELRLGPLMKRNQREKVISTEYGEVLEAKVTDGNEAFHLHFITLEPNSLFLPVLLHSDMVFYVHTGSGRLSYQDEDEEEHKEVRRGDVYRLRAGTVFFIQSNLESERQKLRIIAIFDNSEYKFNVPAFGPYSSIANLLLGFDREVLRAAFKVPEEVIEQLVNGTKPPHIIHALPRKKDTIWGIENEIMEGVLSILDFSNKHKKKSKLFNIFGEDPDFQNCNGWSTTVDKKKYGALKGYKFGIFMVNLTTGSMMGPHWNPMATEIGIVLHGQGMVRVVCSSSVNTSMCRNTRFRVQEGDVFVVPRFHPMAQMAFNNETFVFMGFSTSVKKNHPQYLAGKASVLRTLDKQILATSFGVNYTTFEWLLAQKNEAVILDCTSCAEEEWKRMVEEIEKERQREREREKEEARREAEERQKREEEARKREEEEAKKREEEAQRKREEEEAAREEEAAKQEEARKKREEEEAQRKREEEERERQEQQQREQEERERAQEAEREREEAAKREEEAAKEAEARAAEEAQRRREEEEKERQKQQQHKQEEREKQQQQQREQEEREAQEREQEQAAAQQAEREREEAARREEEAAKEAEARAAAEAQRRKEEEEKERQKQQEREQEEREKQEKRRREQVEREAQEREQEQAEAQQAEKEREAAARREEEAARKAEEAQGRGQGGGQQEAGQGEQPSGERGGQEAGLTEEEAAAKQEAAAKRQWEEAQGRGEQGRGWPRRILEKTA